MKIYLKILLIIFATFITIENICAQKYFPLKASPELLIGKWRSSITNGIIYELEFNMDIIEDGNDTIEFIIGKVKCTNNGMVIRQTEFDGSRSIINGNMATPKKALLTFFDKDNKVWMECEFTMNETHPNAAVLKFTKALWSYDGWNQVSPDIPDGIAFLKQSESDGGNAGFEPIDPIRP